MSVQVVSMTLVGRTFSGAAGNIAAFLQTRTRGTPNAPPILHIPELLQWKLDSCGVLLAYLHTHTKFCADCYITGLLCFCIITSRRDLSYLYSSYQSFLWPLFISDDYGKYFTFTKQSLFFFYLFFLFAFVLFQHVCKVFFSFSFSKTCMANVPVLKRLAGILNAFNVSYFAKTLLSRQFFIAASTLKETSKTIKDNTQKEHKTKK